MCGSFCNTTYCNFLVFFCFFRPWRNVYSVCHTCPVSDPPMIIWSTMIRHGIRHAHALNWYTVTWESEIRTFNEADAVADCELTISVFREADKYTVYCLLGQMRIRKWAYGTIKTRKLHFVKINVIILWDYNENIMKIILLNAGSLYDVR
jgi:hypothetical protein